MEIIKNSNGNYLIKEGLLGIVSLAFGFVPSMIEKDVWAGVITIIVGLLALSFRYYLKAKYNGNFKEK